MAPRKKTRLPSRAASTPSADAGDLPAGGTETSPQPGGGKNTIILDAWTDEQETALLKSVISWKPVGSSHSILAPSICLQQRLGMHKHFRMIAILENLRSHGHTSPTDDHTKPSGVWKKLGELYNLEALDQREDGFGYPVLNDVTKEPYVDFDLPDEEYSDMIFARRLAPAGTSSPPALPFQMSRGTAAQAGRRNSTVDDSEGLRNTFSVLLSCD